MLACIHTHTHTHDIHIMTHTHPLKTVCNTSHLLSHTHTHTHTRIHQQCLLSNYVTLLQKYHLRFLSQNKTQVKIRMIYFSKGKKFCEPTVTDLLEILCHFSLLYRSSYFLFSSPPPAQRSLGWPYSKNEKNGASCTVTEHLLPRTTA